MKVALVHDWLVNYAGSERSLHAIAEIYPEAPIYTSVCDPSRIKSLAEREIHVSFLDKLPGARRNHSMYIGLMPLAFERMDFSGYDLVISSTHACAKGVVTPPETLHICYCYTPTRYFWDFFHRYINDPSYFGILNGIVRLFAPVILTYLRVWDRSSADRVDHFVAISDYIAQRIRKYYRKNAVVIYPPVDTANYAIAPHLGDYYLLLARLVPYKRTDIAIQAFNQLGLKLKIAGEGPELGKLKRQAGPNIEFLGNVSETDKAKLMAECQAFIFPPEEDFGIAPVEVMAAGRPVIAYAKGGALETIIEGTTGTFFHAQTKAAIIDAVTRFQTMTFNPEAIRKHALKFDKSVFVQKISTYVQDRYREFQRQ